MISLLSSMIKPVYAHCDVPCGIYETDTMRHAAATCLKMIDKREALGELNSDEAQNAFVRIVMTKEKHAQKCKDEIAILWTDYFKPEHVKQFPELHETLWHAAKAASKVKQSMDRQAAEELVAAVEQVSALFARASAS